jgi:hypothetical protein
MKSTDISRCAYDTDERTCKLTSTFQYYVVMKFGNQMIDLNVNQYHLRTLRIILKTNESASAKR